MDYDPISVALKFGFLAVLYLQRVLGYDAVQTGAAFLPISLTIGILSVGFSARLNGRFGPRAVLIPALASIVESARAELQPRGITFTAVFPGFVDTPMFRANAYKKPYWLPARDAAERIYLATLRRRETLAFPVRQHARVRMARMLPPRLRDPLTRQAMDPPADIGSPPA